MLKKNTTITKCIIVIITISLFLASCGSKDDLPDGAEYFSPIWFENLSEYASGNYNQIHAYKNGYAPVSFAKMGKHWDVSNESWGVIDKNGEFVLEPLSGDLDIKIIDNEHFYIRDNENYTSKLVDTNGDLVASLDGTLSGGYGYDGDLFNKDGISYLCCNNIISQSPYKNEWKYGLANKSGQVLVPSKYGRPVSTIEDAHFVFPKYEKGGIADVYNSNGSFSHSVYLDYEIKDYNFGLLKIHSSDGYGVADINGNIIVTPNNARIEIISEDFILVAKDTFDSCQLINNKGETIKEFGLSLFGATEMYNDMFALYDNLNTYLITCEGEISKELNGFRSPKYCGNGIIALTFGNYGNSHIQLINIETSEFIGEEYKDRYDIKFNEGYAVVEDLDLNMFVIDKYGNKYCEGYDILGYVTDRVVRISTATTTGIICLPPIK